MNVSIANGISLCWLSIDGHDNARLPLLPPDTINTVFRINNILLHLFYYVNILHMAVWHIILHLTYEEQNARAHTSIILLPKR